MLKGSIVALITPFINNEIDYEKLEYLLNFHVENKTDGLLLLGTTAESSTLSKQESIEIVKFCIKYLNNRIPLLVGICTNSTSKAINDCILYESLGIDNFLVITPYYNKSNNTGLFKHFESVATSTKSNIIIYNIPNRTGVVLEYTVVEQLSKINNIIGIKEANENFKDSIKLFSLQNDNFSIYCGNDEFIIPFMSLGAKGFINVCGNILPKQYNEMYKLCINNKYTDALNIFNIYKNVIFNVFLETNPIGIKEAMNILNMINNEIRLPLCTMEEIHLNILKKEILKIGKYFNC